MTVRFAVLIAAAITFLALVGFAVERIHRAGQDAARAELRRADDAAQTRATDARRDHDRACATGDPACLRDAWTRD